MNQNIFEHLAKRFREQTGIDIRGDRKAEARLLEAAEIAKIELSTSSTTHVSLPYPAVLHREGQRAAPSRYRSHAHGDGARDTSGDRIVAVRWIRRDAGITPNEIDRIVFVGGPTRMPSVRAFFEEMLGRTGESGIDPMECVAQGAAIQAGVLSGEVGNIVLVDVTPLTLGVETLGGVATSLIARNTPVPVKHSEVFTTAADMQTSVTVHVYQGERPMAADNTSLGQFNLDGLVPAPRGVPKIEVTFDIDANGILNVTAKDQATGKSQSIAITGSTRLSADEKERMIKEAEKYAEQDKRRRERADKLNEADAVCYQAEKMLAEFSDKLTEDVRKRIEENLRQTREALTKQDAALATERAEALKKVMKEAGIVIYAQTPQAGVYKETRAPGTAATVGEGRPTGAGPRGRVVDADYKETS